MLVRHEGIALVACGELGLLHHVDVVLHAFAAGICVGELEGVDSSSHRKNRTLVWSIEERQGATGGTPTDLPTWPAMVGSSSARTGAGENIVGRWFPTKHPTAGAAAVRVSSGVEKILPSFCAVRSTTLRQATLSFHSGIAF